MNKFELFSLIFYAIDVYYDNNPSEEIGQFLSEMSPFTFKQICSADPEVYDYFCSYVGEEEITVQNSYKKAIRYIESIHEVNLRPAFEKMTEEKWVEGCNKYLASEHKGMELDE